MKTSFADLGFALLQMVEGMDSPLGRFVRAHSHPLRPPPTNEATFERRGDLLPIHPTAVEVGHHGVTEANEGWVKITIIILNFHCAGWSKPICVPMDTRLSDNQRGAIREVAQVVDQNILSAKLLPSFGDAKKKLQSKKYDYAGNPVEYMMDLEAKLVVPTWPKPGEAGVRCITDFLSGEALAAMQNPHEWLLPPDLLPEK